MTTPQYKYIHDEQEKSETDSVKCIKKTHREKASTALHAEKGKVHDRLREQEGERRAREERGKKKMQPGEAVRMQAAALRGLALTW